MTAAAMLDGLRASREDYERVVVGYRANFWNGLVNRWDKALAVAKSFSAEAPAPTDPIDIPPFIPPQPPKTGTTMPPETAQPYNAALEDCVIELAKAQRPIIEKYIKGSQALTPEQIRAEVIRSLGGTPPAITGTTAPPPGTKPVDPAAPPVTPVDATKTNVAVGAGGVIASLIASLFGVIGTPVGPDQTTVGSLLPLLSMGAAAFGIPAPIVSILSGLWAKFRGQAPAKAA